MKLWRIVILVLIALVMWYITNRISLDRDVVVKQWDTYQTFLSHMSWWDRITFKIFLKLNYQKTPTLYPGVYRVDKSLSYHTFLNTITTAPKPITVKVTFLEWRSSWDYDTYLSRKGLIQSGEYRSLVTNNQFIDTVRSEFTFLPEKLTSLEWFLYPDTYHLDANKWSLPEQLIKLQLDAFYTKVRGPDPTLFTDFSRKLANDGFVFKMSPYSIVKLASIIENEEKDNQNKQTIAGIFLNRIAEWMQLGADVTLCYGKSITYDQCTPSFIVKHLYDKSNPYNTRTNAGLPPTPISNPSVYTFAWVLTYHKTNYLYYLHDSEWTIHYGSTLQQHNENKQNFLK